VPRGTAEDWKPYSKYLDVAAVDMYWVAYPPGVDSGTDNKEMSVVGDYAQMIRRAVDYKKPTMMTLQICWSGVGKPGRTLRYPTFFEQRYMSYQAIIDGARALLYFGGDLPRCLNTRDAAYGWNWNFFDRILRPVREELQADGPLIPALIAPASKMQISTSGDAAAATELTVREAGQYIYILAARREGSTVQTTFSGLPKGIKDGEVLFESPRHVSVADGAFTDWFGPHDVHVYRFQR
jgi:hypothetical protein